jgi:formyltetrahydrofolate-dependent phosphoribosylglycinamide formyltransferase
MIKLGVLGSTKGTDLQAIINAINSGALKAQVSVVISNKSKSYILERARLNQIPSFFVSTKNKTRSQFDSEITNLLIKKEVGLVLLIGFMRILSAKFCQKWHKKIINVHPSLLPKYSGGMDTNVHSEVLKNNDRETGCTIHFVTEEVDSGPILVQKRCSVNKQDTISSLKKKVQKLEGDAFIEAIKTLSIRSVS